jgi:polar amino acid transport system substrate-binding protein
MRWSGGRSCAVPRQSKSAPARPAAAKKEEKIMRGVGRRGILKGGGAGLAALGAAAATTGALVSARQAAAQSAEDSLLRTVLDRGHLIVGTGSTNAPWHFEDEDGNLVGMDITMARILAQGLFDDPEAVEFVQQDPAARIPNITTGKVDIVIQFMTITGGRAQLVNFTRPYYVEGIALLTRPDAERKTFDDLMAGGSETRVSILQNVDAEQNVHLVLPESQVLLIDTQANVIQALDSNRADAAAVDLSTVRWLAKLNPDRYYQRQALVLDALRRRAAPGRPRLAALRQHDLRRRDVRPRQRPVRCGLRRLLRRGDPGAPDGLPADLSRPSLRAPQPSPPRGLRVYAALFRRTPPPSVSMTLFRSLTQA